ncbi:hypothetical protein [Vibrio nitrifigilis]|uniref:Uncharacterized protein n=1 Tax=Vibrio nitrifigilis TaxID=2789781 RepID=A0ABS0GCX2_9VIBR|nr:hypothetical protein [Vibrio nitrifigilis]MBF9000266.1 hypothetical protein [Vibrio nitrifigilis]
MKSKLIIGLGLIFGYINSSNAISITIGSAEAVCAVSVSGTATGGATAVSLYLEQDGTETTLVVNDSISTDGTYEWTGVVSGISSLDDATIKAVTNRQVSATSNVNGSCVAG